jgi:phosphohistidine phosphatase
MIGGTMGTPLVLDLLRHGRAMPAGAGSDHARPLTAAGRVELERLGERLAREGTRHDRVFASPLERAAESARTVLAAFSDPPAVETLAALAPDADPAGLLDALRRLGVAGGHALLVGHQPLLGQFALLLTGAEIAFAPGSMVRIECPRGAVAGTGRVLLALHPGPGG